MTENSSETGVKAPKRFRKTKIALLILLALVVVKLGSYYWFDRPLAALNAMAVVEPDAYSPDVDYKTVYDEAQAKAYLPAEENGFRMLLAASGPKCLGREELGWKVPWEEFPTNKDTKDFFEDPWTPLCKFYELDPTAKPTALDRLSLADYLVKYGVKGDETSPNAGKPVEENPYPPVEEGEYWENYQKLYGVIGSDESWNVIRQLEAAPWTAEEFPVAARWIKENADYYDLVSRAVREPKFGGLRQISEDYDMISIDSCYRYLRELSNMLKLRANYRLGAGDVAGALDDFESTTLLMDAIFRDETAELIPVLIGVAAGEDALSMPLEVADRARPTVDECRRVVELVSKYTREEAWEQRIQQSVKNEQFFVLNQIALLLRQHRRSKLSALFPLCMSPVDDEKVIRNTCKIWEEYAAGVAQCDEITRRPHERVAPKDYGFFELTKKYLFLNETFAEIYTDLFNPKLGNFAGGLHRFEALARLKQIAAAILAYEADHGTFPPAFSVDANGQPLLSWRVLILP
ncbi:MAG: DUF1559 domain-containing protein [Thermoguttaceae bacterium]|jgi:hypothetical protein